MFRKLAQMVFELFGQQVGFDAILFVTQFEQDTADTLLSAVQSRRRGKLIVQIKYLMFSDHNFVLIC